ncbi:MAG: hypothetical protein B6I38_04610 [Anaerolineaceae bacterium 4572_5.1]|nr:MAG: hypothetical protein B6I38_04610 [Anaerolineaceae bacterium 4572_5.1]RLD05235.1 MAG: hypothetical protein DRI56_10000 [Chloroflexota bacterium]
MKLLRCFCILAVISGVTLLSACIPVLSAHGEINIASIKTDIQEDISGRNTFLLVVPKNQDCRLLDLDSRLDELRNQATTRVEYNHYQDDEYRGYQLTYHFENPDQIPGQIERIKRIIVETAIEGLPTPEPIPVEVEVDEITTSEPIPVEVGIDETIILEPYYGTVGLYDTPDQLSIQIAKPVPTLTGLEWDVLVTINPLLLTGWASEDFGSRQLPEVCRISNFTYTLQVPGEIRSFQVNNETMPEFLQFSTIRKTRKNSIEWTIKTKQAAELLASDIELFIEEINELSETEQEEKWPNEKFEEDFMNLWMGPPYTLTVKSTPPLPLFQVLTKIVAPIIALIGGVLGIIIGLFKVKQIFKQRHDKNENHQDEKP